LWFLQKWLSVDTLEKEGVILTAMSHHDSPAGAAKSKERMEESTGRRRHAAKKA
jgi:hypothetical protein